MFRSTLSINYIIKSPHSTQSDKHKTYTLFSTAYAYEEPGTEVHHVLIETGVHGIHPPGGYQG